MKIQKLLFFFLLFALVSCGNDKPEVVENQPDTATGVPVIDQLNQEIEKEPDNAALRFARGQAWYENEGYDEAITDLKKAISIDSLQPEFHHLLADVYMDYFRSRQGLKVMQDASFIFPERIPTLLKLSEFQLILKQYDAAKRTLKRIEKIDPLNAEMYYMLGSIFEEEGKPDLAINAFQSAVENDANLIDGYIKLGDLWSAKGEKVAGAFYDNALRIDSLNVIALHQKASYLFNVEDDAEGALMLFAKIVRIDQYYEDAYYNSGLIYLNQNNFAAAEQQFDLAVKASPTLIMGYYYRGFAAENQGKLQQAKTDYDQV